MTIRTIARTSVIGAAVAVFFASRLCAAAAGAGAALDADGEPAGWVATAAYEGACVVVGSAASGPEAIDGLVERLAALGWDVEEVYPADAAEVAAASGADVAPIACSGFVAGFDAGLYGR